MSLAGDRGSKDVVDQQLKQFVKIVATNQRFQSLVHDLTDICWDTCMDKLLPKLESRTKSCITNCVERFIDTTNFITNRLQVLTDASDNGGLE